MNFRRLVYCVTVIIIVFICFFFIFRFVEFQKEQELKLYMFTEFHKLGLMAVSSDDYFRENGVWPESYKELLISYPEMKEYIDNPSWYSYTPFMKELGYGKVRFSNNHMGQFSTGSEKSSIEVRFPLDENKDWNYQYHFRPR